MNDHITNPTYPFPGPTQLDHGQALPRECLCVWWEPDDGPLRLDIVKPNCLLHGWVDARASALRTCLARAGQLTAPAVMAEPITRLRYSLRHQPDAMSVRVATADLRWLMLWQWEEWSIPGMAGPLDELSTLIDWNTYPCTPQEAQALRELGHSQETAR